jgi:chlorite dismutase
LLSSAPVVGEGLPLTVGLEALPGFHEASQGGWALRGATSNERYLTKDEKGQLVARQEGIGRPSSTLAALIPIKKSEEWWTLAQNERREIFEERSHHIHLGLGVLPGVARRLHHCRDLGFQEPFDFLTWFEYAPEDSSAFEDLVSALRETLEWTYVVREVDIRLSR